MMTMVRRNHISVGEQKLNDKLTYLRGLITEDNLLEHRFMIIPAYREFKRLALLSSLDDEVSRRLCFEIASTLYYTYLSYQKSSVDNKLNLYITALLTTRGEDIYSYTEEFIRAYVENKDKQVHNIIKSAKVYISEHISDELSVADLANRFYVTPNYFSRLFKKVEGEGCNEYIVRMRIEKAMSLLETTNFKTGKIASMVGYHDNNYFSLSFKKVTGMSPTCYREMSRSQVASGI